MCQGCLSLRIDFPILQRLVIEAEGLVVLAEKTARIAEIEFVDLYEDVAVEAAHELLALADRMNGDLTDGQIIDAAEIRKIHVARAQQLVGSG